LDIRLTRIIQTCVAPCEALFLQRIQYLRSADREKIRRSGKRLPSVAPDVRRDIARSSAHVSGIRAYGQMADWPGSDSYFMRRGARDNPPDPSECRSARGRKRGRGTNHRPILRRFKERQVHRSYSSVRFVRRYPLSRLPASHWRLGHRPPADSSCTDPSPLRWRRPGVPWVSPACGRGTSRRGGRSSTRCGAAFRSARRPAP